MGGGDSPRAGLTVETLKPTEAPAHIDVGLNPHGSGVQSERSSRLICQRSPP